MKSFLAFVCGIHCAAMPLVPFLGAAAGAFMERLEPFLVVIILLQLAHTLRRLWRTRRRLFVLGVGLGVGLMLSVLRLPHEFMAVFLVIIGGFQFASRSHNHVECRAK